jgi:hypothetical protein
MSLRDRPPGPFIFILGRRQNGIHPGGQSARIILRLKTRFDFILRDLLARRIRQNALQTVTHLNEHLPVLNEHKKNNAIVLDLLSDFPGARHANGVIVNRRVGLHLRINRHKDLIARRLLESFEFCVELARNRCWDNVGVIVEILRRSRGNYLRAE